MPKLFTALCSGTLIAGSLLALWLGEQVFYLTNYTLLVYAVGKIVAFACLFPLALSLGDSFVLGAAAYTAVKCATTAVKAVVRSLECR